MQVQDGLEYDIESVVFGNKWIEVNYTLVADGVRELNPATALGVMDIRQCLIKPDRIEEELGELLDMVGAILDKGEMMKRHPPTSYTKEVT